MYVYIYSHFCADTDIFCVDHILTIIIMHKNKMNCGFDLKNYYIDVNRLGQCSKNKNTTAFYLAIDKQSILDFKF